MIPILYAKNATEFDNNGIGVLKDAVSCIVTEERNGEYTCTLQYPITGNWYNEIGEGSIIKAKANETSEPQLFRVSKSSKPIKGIVTFSTNHISYDLSGLPLMSLTASNQTAQAAMSAAFSACPLSHGFTAWSDKTVLENVKIAEPRSLRNFIGGQNGSILDLYGGELEFDNFTVKLHVSRGADNGVTIAYGKNLTDAKQDKNIEAVYTHLCPYAIKTVNTYDDDGEIISQTEELVKLTENVIALTAPGNIGHDRALIMDFTDEFGDDEEINETNLRAKATAYIASHELTAPEVNLTVSFMQIWDTPEYRDYAALERVKLCDTVTVRFEALGIDVKAKVIKTVYDSLNERYTSLTIGSARASLADTVININEKIEEDKKAAENDKKSSDADLHNAIIEATNKITGNAGGYVVLYPANYPEEILIMNTNDKATASKVWRWNSAGLGYSSTGYEGPYGIAITADGEIVANYITTGTLSAINISGCTISGGTLDIGSGKFTVDNAGNIHAEGYIKATSGVIGGCSITNGVLDVPAANISGKLTASQINVNDVITEGNISVKTSTIANVEVQYALSTSNTTAPSTGWSTTAPAWENGKYMWQKTVWTYATGSTSESAATCISGAKGETGTSVTILGSYATLADLQAAHPTGNPGDGYLVGGDLYVWNGSAWQDVGQIKGDTGDTGVGVSNITDQYYLSDSNVTTTGGSWVNTCPAWAANKYIWTRSFVEWTDGSTSYTTATIAGAINGANETANAANTAASAAVAAVLDIEGNVYYAGTTEIDGGKIRTGTVTALQINATNLHVSAANIDGTLTIGQLPNTVAETSDIPTNVSDLANDAGYQNSSGVVSIIDGRVTAGYVEALGITVGAAQITGTLTIGQLPSTVAEMSDIPTDVSELNNDAGYQNSSGVVSIIDGRVTAGYVEALGITVGAAQITGQLTASQIDATGITATNATITGTIRANSGLIGNGYYKFTIGSNAIYASIYCGTGSLVTPNMGSANSDVYIGTNGLSYSYVENTELGNRLQSCVIRGGSAIAFGTNQDNEYVAVHMRGDGIRFYNSGSIDITTVDRPGLYEVGSIELWRNFAPYLTGTWYAAHSIVVGSDRNLKNCIENIDSRYIDFIDNLTPCRYKMNDEKSGRYHTGFIAQEVKTALETAGLTANELAALDCSGEMWGLRYEELIAPMIAKIKALENRIKALEK